MILKSLIFTLVFVVVATLVVRWAVGQYTPSAEALYSGGETLSPCPDSPNCVSSTLTDESHHFAAIDGDDATFAKLKKIIASQERVKLVNNSENYLHAEFRTKFVGYVDDLEILHINGSNKIQVRSASRLGRSDFGVNKKRIEALLEQL